MKRSITLAPKVAIILALLALVLATAACSRPSTNQINPPVNAAPGNQPGNQPARGETTTVSIDPATATVPVNGTTTVNIKISNVVNLFGADVRVSFDPAVLEVQDDRPSLAGVQIKSGDFPDASQARGFIAQNSADNSAGRVSYAVTLLSPTPAVTGTGTLASITFKGKAAGKSDIKIDSAMLSDPVGNAIQTATANGSITVGGAQPTGPAATNVPGAATPAATSTATRVAGQPTMAPTSLATTTATATMRPTVATGTATPTPRPTSQPGATCTYTVQFGDTLYSIARRFGSTVQDIAAANNIADPNRIRVGMRLTIPNCHVQPPKTCFLYTVQPGDTVLGLARRFHTSPEMILRVNHIVNPWRIFVGQRLQICPDGVFPPNFKREPIYPNPCCDGRPPYGKPRFYTVQPGDTLNSICARYGMPVQRVIIANNLSSSNSIFVGQQLEIPSDDGNS